MSIRFKPEVRIRLFNEHIYVALLQANLWSLLTNVDVEINSCDDSAHGADTLHGQSLALDIDTVGDKLTDLVSLYNYLRRNLSKEFDVINENDHVHVEWDTHRLKIENT